MKRICVLLPLAFMSAIGLSSIRDADATWFGQHGVACVPAYDADTGNYNYTNEGIFVKAGYSSQTVHCPVTIPGTHTGTNNEEVRVSAYDATSSGVIVCYAHALNSTGTKYTSAARYTSGSFGQYTTVTNSYTGLSYIYWVNPFSGLSDPGGLVFTCILPSEGSGIKSVGVYSTSP